MIRIEFDVHGRTLEDMISAGHKQTKALVGDRMYSWGMDVSQAARTWEGHTIDWVAEFRVTIDDADHGVLADA